MAQSMRFAGVAVISSDGPLYRIICTLRDTPDPLTLEQIRIRCGAQSAKDRRILEDLVKRFTHQGWIQAHQSPPAMTPTYSLNKVWLDSKAWFHSSGAQEEIEEETL